MNYLGGSNRVGFEINKFVNAGKTSLKINLSEIMDKIPLLLSTQVGQFEIFCFSLHEGKILGILSYCVSSVCPSVDGMKSWMFEWKKDIFRGSETC